MMRRRPGGGKPAATRSRRSGRPWRWRSEPLLLQAHQALDDDLTRDAVEQLYLAWDRHDLTAEYAADDAPQGR